MTIPGMKPEAEGPIHGAAPREWDMETSQITPSPGGFWALNALAMWLHAKLILTQRQGLSKAENIGRTGPN